MTGGESWVTFDGSTIATEYRDGVTESKMTMGEKDLVFRSVYHGKLAASYTATDTDLTVADADVTGLTIESSTFVDGEEVEKMRGQEQSEARQAGLGGVWSCTCNERTLTLTPSADGAARVLTRR